METGIVEWEFQRWAKFLYDWHEKKINWGPVWSSYFWKYATYGLVLPQNYFISQAKKKMNCFTEMCLWNCNCVILNQHSSCKQQHMQTHVVCARYTELGKSGEQMSSVPDQLQREVGRSRNTAVQADNRNAQGGDGGQWDGRREREREGWIREWSATRERDTCWETLWNFVSCKEESVCACEADGQTEAVFSSCRPRCYVSSMWHIQPVHGAKNTAASSPSSSSSSSSTQTWSPGPQRQVTT